jgi:hypothetical protein
VGRPILEFLIAQSNRFQGDPYCPVCGNSFTFVDATFWIYAEDEGYTLPLPFCSACESEIFTKKDSRMSTTARQAFDASGWKLAYMAALFETDKRKMNSLIADAEMAVVSRARELFGAEGDHRREKAALDAALLGLHALRGVAEGNPSSVHRIMPGNDLAA